MKNTDPLLTAPECAGYLQVSLPTFWRRVADGTVPPAVKIGSLSRWPRSEILRVIEIAKEQRFHNSGTAAADSLRTQLNEIGVGDAED